MRKVYEAQLQALHREMIAMGALCESAVGLAVQAVTQGEGDLIGRVLETDALIDKKERDIESLCLKLLLKQQPVAADLRAISSALKMISDLEKSPVTLWEGRIRPPPTWVKWLRRQSKWSIRALTPLSGMTWCWRRM